MATGSTATGNTAPTRPRPPGYASERAWPWTKPAVAGPQGAVRGSAQGKGVLRVERDTEARLLGLKLARYFEKSPPSSVLIDLGELPLREAMWALPAAEAACRLVPRGRAA